MFVAILFQVYLECLMICERFGVYNVKGSFVLDKWSLACDMDIRKQNRTESFSWYISYDTASENLISDIFKCVTLIEKNALKNNTNYESGEDYFAIISRIFLIW